jgi:hypothetical protein
MREDGNHFVDVISSVHQQSFYTAALPTTQPLSSTMARMIEEELLEEEKFFSLDEILPWNVPTAPEVPKGFEKLSSALEWRKS